MVVFLCIYLFTSKFGHLFMFVDRSCFQFFETAGQGVHVFPSLFYGVGKRQILLICRSSSYIQDITPLAEEVKWQMVKFGKLFSEKKRWVALTRCGCTMK